MIDFLFTTLSQLIPLSVDHRIAGVEYITDVYFRGPRVRSNNVGGLPVYLWLSLQQVLSHVEHSSSREMPSRSNSSDT